MRVRSGLVLTLAGGLAMSACGGGAGGGGPVTSPTGKTYASGTRPTESRFTTPAKLYVAQGNFEGALQQARSGIAADSANPQHYFLLGQAQAGLGNYVAADSAWKVAEQLYPAYEIEVEPARESAWAEAFNDGVNEYNAGNTAAAATAWENANLIYGLRPEAFQNLAAVYTQSSEYAKAIEAYRGALAAVGTTPATRELTPEEVEERAAAKTTAEENLAELLLFTDQFSEAESLFRQQLAEDPTNVALQGKLAAAIAAQDGRGAEAQAIYNELLARTDLNASTIMEVGVSLFQAEDFARAAEAFERLTTLRPNSRDAWYNRANALYASERWEPLIPVAEKLITLDPLSHDASLILARAYRDAGQTQNALRELTRIDEVPVRVQDLETRQGSGRTIVRGEVMGHTASTGTPIRLRFTFFAEDGSELGAQTVTVAAPAKEATAPFEVTLESETPAIGYKYELVR